MESSFQIPLLVRTQVQTHNCAGCYYKDRNIDCSNVVRDNCIVVYNGKTSFFHYLPVEVQNGN